MLGPGPQTASVPHPAAKARPPSAPGGSSDGAVEHFNGKIERPSIIGHAGRRIAEWDFAIGIPTDIVTDTGPGAFHGRLHNLPNRAATGSQMDRARAPLG